MKEKRNKENRHTWDQRLFKYTRLLDKMNVMSGDDQTLPRKLTAVGTMGQMGQLFTVFEKNWHCKDCGQENYASRLIIVTEFFSFLNCFQTAMFSVQEGEASG